MIHDSYSTHRHHGSNNSPPLFFYQFTFTEHSIISTIETILSHKKSKNKILDYTLNLSRILCCGSDSFLTGSQCTIVFHTNVLLTLWPQPLFLEDKQPFNTTETVLKNNRNQHKNTGYTHRDFFLS